MQKTLSRLLAASLITSGWGTPPIVRADDIDATNVYQRIVDADTNAFSIARFKDGVTPPTADLVLDEQKAASGGRENDNAPRPLVRSINATKFSTGTYPEFIALLDNYVVREEQPDDDSASDQQEINAFLDKVMPSAPMQTALAYIRDELGADHLTDAQFREETKRLWFEIYTNHFGNATPYCSGFEHVFVGEGAYNPNATGTRRGEVKGYHGWVQYVRQEQAGDVDYLGQMYGLPAARMPANPDAITLRMIWNYDPDGAGAQQPVELYKPKGGFFIGFSPECEMALGTTAWYEHHEGLLSNDKRRTAINGTVYDLVLYPSVKMNGQRGEHIRSFFPIVIGMAQDAGTTPAPTPSGDGQVVIHRALPNPDGDDATGEWIEIRNTSQDDLNLEGWRLQDRQGGQRSLTGTLAAGATLRIELDRSSASLVLGNSGGDISLYQEQELVDKVTYGQASREQIFTFHQ